MADYVGLEATGHILLEDGSGLLLEVQSVGPPVVGAAALSGNGSLTAGGRKTTRTGVALSGQGALTALPRRVHNVIIPKLPLVQLTCGPTLCGSGHLCGEIATGDRYYEWRLDLDGGHGDVFWQKNVTIPVLPFSGDAMCGKVICGAPPTLCGQNLRGDNYFQYALDLDGANVTLTLQTVLRPDDVPLELDGGEARVNPILMPEECFDLELAELLCTPLDLAVPPARGLDLVPALATVLTVLATPTEDA